jgi:NAD(P)-dependent dehydrogenase (short-subunit alcohol dehydrogenase family)
MAPKGIINFEDVNLSNASGWTRYGQSKAVPSKATPLMQAVILLAKAMTDKFSKDGLLVFAVNPGGIKTVPYCIS